MRTVPIPGWVKDAVDAWTDAVDIMHGPVFRAINRAASRSSHRTTSVARVRGSVTWLAANWIRFDSSWGTSRSRRRSATLDASSDCDVRLTTVSESSRMLLELRARGAQTSALGDYAFPSRSGLGSAIYRMAENDW